MVTMGERQALLEGLQPAAPVGDSASAGPHAPQTPVDVRSQWDIHQDIMDLYRHSWYQLGLQHTWDHHLEFPLCCQVDILNMDMLLCMV